MNKPTQAEQAKHTTALLSLTLLAMLTSACATKIVSAPLVSMTKFHGQPRPTLSEAGRIKTEWCRGDRPLSGAMEPALMEEVTLKAQKSKKADYIGDAVYWRKGNCMTIEGVALRGGGKK